MQKRIYCTTITQFVLLMALALPVVAPAQAAPPASGNAIPPAPPPAVGNPNAQKYLNYLRNELLINGVDTSKLNFDILQLIDYNWSIVVTGTVPSNAVLVKANQTISVVNATLLQKWQKATSPNSASAYGLDPPAPIVLAKKAPPKLVRGDAAAAKAPVKPAPGKAAAPKGKTIGPGAANPGVTGEPPEHWQVVLTAKVALKALDPLNPADQIKGQVQAVVNGALGKDASMATINVNPFINGSYTVTLTNGPGAMSAHKRLTQSQITALGSAVKQLSANNVNIVNQVTGYDIITREVTLRNLRAAPPGPTTGTAATGVISGTTDIGTTGTDQAAIALASFLNTVSNNTVAVNANENRLVLTGDPFAVQRLRELIALTLDVQSPQVEADVYTIQLNSTPSRAGSAEKTTDKAVEIREGIRIVHDMINAGELAIGGFIANHTDTHSDEYLTLRPLLKEVGFNTEPARPLSITDMLVMLEFSNRDSLRAVMTPDGDFPIQMKKALDQIDIKIKQEYPRHTADLTELTKLMRLHIESRRIEGRYLLDRLVKLYDPSLQKSDTNGFTEFLSTWKRCATALYVPDPLVDPLSGEIDELPGELSTAVAQADLQLRITMDALSEDMDELFVQPLTDWIRTTVQNGDAAGSGINLVGHSKIVVRDRTLAQSVGQATNYFKFTPISKITLSDLASAQQLSSGIAPGATSPTAITPTGTTIAKDQSGNVVYDHLNNPVVLSAGQIIQFDKDGKVIRNGAGDPVTTTLPTVNAQPTVLGALNPLQALAIQTLFKPEDQPVFNSVAPGTDLSIRPFVAANGGSARLQINLATNMTASAASTSTTAAQGGPVNLINSHSVATEVDVSALDLVELSTFAAQTSGLGDYAWRIPVLSNLPLIGDLFHGGRTHETHKQESMVIINLTILPRALDLVPYLASPEASVSKPKGDK